MKTNNPGRWILLITLTLSIGACTINKKLSANVSKTLATSDHYREGKFYNGTPSAPHSFGASMRMAKSYITKKRIDSQPSQPLPLKEVTRAQLDALSNDDFYLIKLGHSSILLKVYGEYWLIDPVFSERASPFGFAGPKRY